MTKPPPWAINKDVARKLNAIIGPEIEERKSERRSKNTIKVLRGLEVLKDYPTPKKLRMSVLVSKLGSTWVHERAMIGHIEPLIEMIRPLRSKSGKLKINPAIAKLSAEMWLLVTNLILSPPQLARRPKRGRGRPKMSEEERRKLNPVHDASEEVPLIVPILKRLYPGRRLEWRKMAVEIAAERRGARASTLARHVARARSDKRRV